MRGPLRVNIDRVRTRAPPRLGCKCRGTPTGTIPLLPRRRYIAARPSGYRPLTVVLARLSLPSLCSSWTTVCAVATRFPARAGRRGAAYRVCSIRACRPLPWPWPGDSAGGVLSIATLLAFCAIRGAAAAAVSASALYRPGRPTGGSPAARNGRAACPSFRPADDPEVRPENLPRDASDRDPYASPGVSATWPGCRRCLPAWASNELWWRRPPSYTIRA